MNICGVSSRVEQLKLKYKSSREAVRALNEVLVLLHDWNIDCDPNANSEWACEERTTALPFSRGDSVTNMLSSNDICIMSSQDIKAVDLSSFPSENILRCQNIVRGWLKRQRLRKITRYALQNVEYRPQRKRNDIWREILLTERSYLKNLNLIKQNYFLPLRRALIHGQDIILPRADFEIVFSKVFESIISFNQDLLAALESFAESWPTKNDIGSIFLNRIPFIRIYTSYVNNYKYSHATRQKYKENRRWISFCQDAQVQSGGKTLSDLLIMPIQRVPRYQMLLQELLKNTPTNHVDFANLDKALESINLMTEELEESKKEADHLERIIVMADILRGENLPEIIVPGRRYIREGYLMKYTTRKRRYFFLLSDLLIITTPQSDGTKLYKDSYTLMEISVTDCHASTFGIQCGRSKTKWTTTTPGEKTGWILDISVAKEQLSRSPKTLNTLLMKSETLPRDLGVFKTQTMKSKTTKRPSLPVFERRKSRSRDRPESP